MTDMTLQILLKAQNQTAGPMSVLKNALGNITFGMKNLRTEGTVGMNALQQGFVGAGNAFFKIGAIAATVGAGVAVAIGVKSVQAAGDFQQAMIKSQAEAGLTKSQMESMGNSILQMAPAVGKAPVDLAKGLFQVESASFSGKDAIDTLRISAQMAAADLTSTDIVAKGLTTSVKAFGYSTSQSALVANQMTVAVANGKMTMAEYSTAIGTVALTAHGFGVSMSATNAALDVLTNNGFPSAARASIGLNNLLSQFDGNTAKVAKNIQALGITGFDPLKFRSMDLGHQVQYLSMTMKGHDDQLKKVLGGSDNAAKAFKALRGDTEGYAQALAKQNSAQKDGGAQTKAFAATQQGFNFQMNQAKAALDVVFIKIGTALLPALSKLMAVVTPIIVNFANWITKNQILEKAVGFVTTAITTLSSWVQNITKFFQQNQAAMAILQGVLIIVAGAIAGALVAAFVAWTIAAGAAAIATISATWPILAIGALIALVVAGIILAVKNWSNIMKWLQGILGSVWSAIASGVSAGAKWVTDGVQGIITNVTNFFTGLPAQALQWGKNLLNGFIDGIKSVATNVGNAVGGVIDNVKNFMGFHSPTKEGPGREANLWGPALVNMFSQDITSNSPKARAAAEHMMSQVAGAVKNYPNLIAQAQMSGNTGQEKALKQQLSMTRSQFSIYKDLLRQDGLKYDQYNTNNPIDFSGGKGKKHKAHYGSTRNGFTSIDFTGSAGSRTSSASSGYSGSGGTTIINVSINVPAGAYDIKALSRRVKDELSSMMDRRANYATNLSGGGL